MQETRQHILEYLRLHGTATVDTLSQEVDLAPVTVRHHLAVLQRDGLIRHHSRPSGRGRPRHIFALTSDGAEALTSDRYKILAARLLDAMGPDGATSAADAMRRIADEVASGASEASAAKSVELRLDAAMGLLHQEGFTANWTRDDATFLVHVVGCPYRALAKANNSVCRFDAELVRVVTRCDVEKEGACGVGGECLFRVSGP